MMFEINTYSFVNLIRRQSVFSTILGILAGGEHWQMVPYHTHILLPIAYRDVLYGMEWCIIVKQGIGVHLVY